MLVTAGHMIVLAPIYVVVPIVVYAYPLLAAPVPIEQLFALRRPKHPMGFFTAAGDHT